MQHVIKCYLSAVYEVLLMLAFTLTLTAVFYTCVGDASSGYKRLLLQAVLWSAMAVYFVRCWTVSGQTLACQTWKLKIVRADGRLLSMREAFLRYVLATLVLIPAGAGWWWALWDKEGCYLHDRLLGNRIIAKLTST